MLRDKPRLQEVIDMTVWAEIPDEERYPELNVKVLRHMIHGPCGDPSHRHPCTGDNGKCSKRFPKEFREETNANVNGYPMYQRKNFEKKYIVRVGAKCFEDLKTVNGVLYKTFKDAAIAKNLVEADDLWEETLEETTDSKMPVQLRKLFANICIYGTPTDVLTLWNNYKDHMIEDFVHNNVVNPENMALNHIQEILRNNGSSSTLLKGGKTYHSLFKLSIPIDDGAKSNIRGNSQAARELISAKLIIWDEVSMTVGHVLTAVDKLFKDLMKNPRPFGGKVILFAGDFRQNLPVVPHAHKAAIIESTVKYNPIWRNVIQIKLQQNMRTADEKEFANWLMQLRDGKLSNTDGLHLDTIEIPQDFISKESIITEIFDDRITMEQRENPDRAILCPKNEDTFKINDEILRLMEGEEKEYLSIDSIVSDNPQEQLNYPTEFLNSMTPSGMPVH
ncbi:uncharacterized protein [Temnothorax longispinosus]|uniref:uncharacterized protein n=1 Tax=Temnothorax longispinosus TaxID=300112 RepID=UPI003A9A0540